MSADERSSMVYVAVSMLLAVIGIVMLATGHIVLGAVILFSTVLVPMIVMFGIIVFIAFKYGRQALR